MTVAPSPHRRREPSSAQTQPPAWPRRPWAGPPFSSPRSNRLPPVPGRAWEVGGACVWGSPARFPVNKVPVCAWFFVVLFFFLKRSRFFAKLFLLGNVSRRPEAARPPARSSHFYNLGVSRGSSQIPGRGPAGLRLAERAVCIFTAK